MPLYTAGNEFANGCWEPAAIQRPDGEVQVFFADEGPYRESGEQEITLLRSNNGGITWSTPETVSFRAKHRDGMPVPLVLKENRGIVLAIEDDGLSGRFKPAIIRTATEDNWSSGTVWASRPSRWATPAALLPPSHYAGAPYLCQLPSGDVLRSFQESGSGNLETSWMAVCIGDKNAKDFAAATYPFPKNAMPQLWNSLFVKNAGTVTAVSTTTIDGVAGIWAIHGKLKQAERQ